MAAQEFEDSRPYIDLDAVEDLIDELRSAIVPLIETIGNSDINLAQPRGKEHPM